MSVVQFFRDPPWAPAVSVLLEDEAHPLGLLRVDLALGPDPSWLPVLIAFAWVFNRYVSVTVAAASGVVAIKRHTFEPPMRAFSNLTPRFLIHRAPYGEQEPDLHDGAIIR